MWNDVIHLFQEYMGTGLIVIWFVISLLYLLLTEKRKPVRILFVYVPILLLLLFFNPLVARLVYSVVGNEIYYRILWLMPITVTIAFAVVDFIGRLEGYRRAAFGVLAGIVIMLSGSYIYKNPYFRQAENLYHVPQSVVDICDAIEVKGREVKAVFPEELLQYVRQYSPLVCMPYGREILVDRWTQSHDIYDMMQGEVIDAEQMAALGRANECHYIILPEDKAVSGDFADYEYECFAVMHGYVIYMDTTANFSVFMEE